jgi:predicted ATPase/class 3 adenylate cyclase/tetratricopeptide (TPR) repeat protein
MTELPTGTVTFLFTDVEGSTHLWELNPPAMKAATARHDSIVEETIAQFDGVLVRPRGEGDSRFAVFARASDAVAAAVRLQVMLHAEPWPPPTPLRVRMALHTGEADLRQGDYYGAAVNRCARLRAIVHGGQILLSQTTHDLVRIALPEGLSLRDLGEHRLTDLTYLEHVFQVTHPDLPADFPSLRSLDAYAHNLPLQLTSFVGREREMTEVKRLLQVARLLTLIGTGGCGKTRLALQVAADQADAFADGVWFVDLAPLADPTLVPQVVATILGVREVPARPPLVTLVDSLRGRDLLLILDNCEHLLDACARLADALLRACAHVRIVATSREAFGLNGETAWRVPSLSLPDPHVPPTLASLTEYESVQLFVERARAVLPSYAIADQSALAVAQVCWRLDGIPLAIELAAARVRVLNAEQIAARLDDRFRLLTGGSRAALRRQQTLRALIDWSYDLLSDAEQSYFEKLSVFAGGWQLEAAESVCAADGGGESVLDLLTALVDKSLVVVESVIDSVPRYRLLETLREYAYERLVARGDAARVRAAHAAYYLSVVEDIRRAWDPAGQRTVRSHLRREQDNLRTVLAWTREHGDPDVRSKVAAALAWVAGVLVDAFHGEAAATNYERLLSLARETGDTLHELEALLGLAQSTYVLALDDPTTQSIGKARDLYDAAYALARQTGNRAGMVRSLTPSIWFVDFWPDYQAQAEIACREAIDLSRESGDPNLIADSQIAGMWFLRQVEAEKQAAELIVHLERRGDLVRLNRLYFALMWENLYWGQYSRAVECCDAGIDLARTMGVPPVQYPSLKALALIYLGRYAEAWDTLQQEVADDVHPFGRAMRYLATGVYFYELAAYERALEFFKRLDTAARRVNRAWLLAWAQIGLGASLLHLGRVADARAKEVAPSSKVTAGCEIAAPCLPVEISLVEGRFAEVYRQTEEATRRAELRERPPDLLVAREAQVRSLLGLDRAADALILADATLTLARQLKHSSMVWRLEGHRASALAHLGDSEAATAARQAVMRVIDELAAAIDEPDLRAGFREAAERAPYPTNGQSVRFADRTEKRDR